MLRKQPIDLATSVPLSHGAFFDSGRDFYDNTPSYLAFLVWLKMNDKSFLGKSRLLLVKGGCEAKNQHALCRV